MMCPLLSALLLATHSPRQLHCVPRLAVRVSRPACKPLVKAHLAEQEGCCPWPVVTGFASCTNEACLVWLDAPHALGCLLLLTKNSSTLHPPASTCRRTQQIQNTHPVRANTCYGMRTCSTPTQRLPGWDGPTSLVHELQRLDSCGPQPGGQLPCHPRALCAAGGAGCTPRQAGQLAGV